VKPEDALGLLIRVFGLLIVAYAIYDEMFAGLEAAGFIPNARETASKHGLFAILYFLIGIVIVKAADQIVRFAYGTKNSRSAREERGDTPE
jgi:hypothetical protein